MKAYKGFNRHEDGTLWCRDFQYVPGQIHKLDGEPELCERGFHACHELHQCWLFYPNNGKNVYYEVECSGTIIEDKECVEWYDYNGKFVCTEIQLIKEIPVFGDIFDCCGGFQNGYGNVILNGKRNLITTEGKLVSEQWWDECWNFWDGYARVWLDNKCNHITPNGNPISEQWWQWCSDFQDGRAKVKLDGKYNYINTDGKLLYETWFEEAGGWWDM